MRKIVQNKDTGEIVLVWQLWQTGGAWVVTIPAALVLFGGEDDQGRKWLVVEEDGPKIKMRILLQAEIDKLNLGD